MKQKIEVQVTAAVDEQWPKVFMDDRDAFAKESRWVIAIVKNVPNMVLYDSVHEDEHATKPKPQFMDAQTVAIGFADFDSMVAWWTNPQPIKQEPEAVELWKIPANSFFIHHGELYRDTDISDGNGHCSVYHQGDGKIVEMSSETMVTPFYGTIAINVGRDAE